MRGLLKKAAVLSVLLSGVFSLTSSAAQKEVPGYIRGDVFYNLNAPNAVSSVTGDPRYPNSPTETQFLRFFEFPPGADDGTAPGNLADNYGARVWGFLTPKETAQYIFFIASDDPGELWLSTDATEANKKLIAREPEWNGIRAWASQDRRSGCPDACINKSAPIRLEANKKYFVEAIFKEGLGGDNLAVTWIKSGEPDPENGALPITREFLSSLADDKLSITVGPAAAIRDEGQTAMFSVAHTSLGPDSPVTYQWLKNGTAIAGATEKTFTTAVLTPADSGAKYSVRLSAGGQTVTSTEADLTVFDLGAPILTPGFLTFHSFLAINGTPVQNLLDDPKYPGSPDDVGYLADFNSRWAYPDDSHENYGARIFGWFTPITSGDYEFFARSDDASQLFLSTDDKEANLTMIAEETGCCGGFEDPGAPETSAPITLVGGRRYFIQLIYKEGGGGDWAEVGVRKVGDPKPTAPIPGGFLSTMIPSKGSVTITTQPANVTGVEGKNATFSLDVTSTHGPLSVQWQKNGVALSGSGKSITLGPLTAADNNSKIKASVSVPGAVATSTEATLTVVPDTIPPVPVAGALKKGANQEIGITFDEPVDAASVTVAANYTLSAGRIEKIEFPTRATTGFSADLPAGRVQTYTGVKIVASGLTPGQEYSVSVKGVKDAKGNAITAPVNASFKAEASKTWNVVGAREAGFVDDVVAAGSEGVDILSGGVGFWSDYDEATFVNEEITGNFDKIAQLEYQDPSSQWARTGLMVRESLDEGKGRPVRGDCTAALVDGVYCVPQAQLHSRIQTVHANPEIRWDAGTANNAYENHYRDETTYTRGWGDQLQSADGGFGPMRYPDVWMRIARQGNFLITYRSTDGVTWNQMTRREFPNLAAKLFVGPFLAPELGNNGTRDGLGHSVLAKFRNYRNFGTTTTPGGKIDVARTANGLTLTFTGTLQSSDSVTGPWADVGASPQNVTFTGTAKFFRLKP